MGSTQIITPAGQSTTTASDGENDGDDDGVNAKEDDSKPVCFCNWDRANCSECGKGYMQELNAGRPCKLGYLSKDMVEIISIY